MWGWIENENADCGSSSGLEVKNKDVECKDLFSVAKEIRAPKILRVLHLFADGSASGVS